MATYSSEFVVSHTCVDLIVDLRTMYSTGVSTSEGVLLHQEEQPLCYLILSKSCQRLTYTESE